MQVQKLGNMSGINKVHPNCDSSDRNIVKGTRYPILNGFALVKLIVHKKTENPQLNLTNAI